MNLERPGTIQTWKGTLCVYLVLLADQLSIAYTRHGSTLHVTVGLREVVGLGNYVGSVAQWMLPGVVINVPAAAAHASCLQTHASWLMTKPHWTNGTTVHHTLPTAVLYGFQEPLYRDVRKTSDGCGVFIQTFLSVRKYAIKLRLHGLHQVIVLFIFLY